MGDAACRRVTPSIYLVFVAVLSVSITWCGIGLLSTSLCLLSSSHSLPFRFPLTVIYSIDTLRYRLHIIYPAIPLHIFLRARPLSVLTSDSDHSHSICLSFIPSSRLTLSSCSLSLRAATVAILAWCTISLLPSFFYPFFHISPFLFLFVSLSSSFFTLLNPDRWATMTLSGRFDVTVYLILFVFWIRLESRIDRLVLTIGP